jgi:transcription antitermination protein NusB
MQTLYAFEECKRADYHIAVDQIRTAFLPDLNSMEVQDKELLEKRKQSAIELFARNFDQQVMEAGEETSEEVRKAASEAVTYYHKLVEQDYQHFKKFMVAEAEHLAEMYLKMLLLLVQWGDAVRQEDEERRNSPLRNLQPTYASELNLANNRVIDLLRKGKEFQQRIIKKGLSWDEDIDLVWEWYKDLLKKDETYREYKKKPQTTFEEDKQIVLHIIKKIIFKSEAIRSYLEENILGWIEDKSTVRSMMVKTIKNLEEDNLEQEDFELIELSPNWEDDLSFFKELFQKTVAHDKEYEEIVGKRTRNWEINRVATMDRILLKMAVAELINFPSIPVKVTINEYIELSKNYSTPKSKQFVNGILDVIAEQLQEEGVVRKSGRGLIDNK